MLHGDWFPTRVDVSDFVRSVRWKGWIIRSITAIFAPRYTTKSPTAVCAAILMAGSRAVSNVYIVTRAPEARVNVVAGSVQVMRRAVGARTIHSLGTGLISNSEISLVERSTNLRIVVEWHTTYGSAGADGTNGNYCNLLSTVPIPGHQQQYRIRYGVDCVTGTQNSSTQTYGRVKSSLQNIWPGCAMCRPPKVKNIVEDALVGIDTGGRD